MGWCGFFLLFVGTLCASSDPFSFFSMGVARTVQPNWVNPEDAFQRLMEGNARYAADKLNNPDRSSLRRQEVFYKQKPFAVVVGCSDARVPPEIIFDQGIGDLFVVRVAGQVVGPIELDSIEYAAKYLGSSLVIVLGHQSCGAVNAVLKGKTQDIEDIANLITPAIQHLRKKTLENAVKANVLWVTEHLKTTPLIQSMMKEKKINVVGGYYSLADGKVEILEAATQKMDAS